MSKLEEIKAFTKRFDPWGGSIYPPEDIEWLIEVADAATEVMRVYDEEAARTLRIEPGRADNRPMGNLRALLDQQ